MAPLVLLALALVAPSAGASSLLRDWDRRYGFQPAFPELSPGGSGPAPEALPGPLGARTVPFNGRSFPVCAFRPGDPVAELAAAAVGASAREIRLALYDLDQPSASEALSAAKAKGVRVRIVGDLRMLFPREGERSASVERLLAEGFEFRVLRGGGEFGSMHLKAGLFDDGLLMTGSYNWKTTSEDEHFENALFTDDPEELEGYRRYWDWLWAHALDAGEALRRGPEQAPTEPEPPYPPQDPTHGVRFHSERFPDYVFSPEGGTRLLVARAVRTAKRRVDAAMFSFYDFGIAGALLSAHENGREVRLLVDKDQAKSSPVVPWLAEKGLPLRVLAGPNGEGPHSRMHNKFAVLDWQLLVSGSYNWSHGAELRNYEETRFLNEEDEVRAYTAYFNRMWERAEPPAGAGGPGAWGAAGAAPAGAVPAAP